MEARRRGRLWWREGAKRKRTRRKAGWKWRSEVAGRGNGGRGGEGGGACVSLSELVVTVRVCESLTPAAVVPLHLSWFGRKVTWPSEDSAVVAELAACADSLLPHCWFFSLFIYLYIYFFVTWQSRNYSALRWRCPGHLSYFERQCWTRKKKSSGCQLGEEAGSEFFFPWLEDVFRTRQCELKPARGLVFTTDCLLSLPEQHESGLGPEIWPWLFFIMCVLVISRPCCTHTSHMHKWDEWLCFGWFSCLY